MDKDDDLVKLITEAIDSQAVGWLLSGGGRRRDLVDTLLAGGCQVVVVVVAEGVW